MKYTNYVINGNPLHYDEFSAIVIPTIIFAIPAVIGMISGAIIMDSGRLIKLRYLLYMKAQHRVQYLKSVVISLDHDVNEWIILRTA